MEQRLIDGNALRENSKMLYSIHSFEPVEGYTQDQIDEATAIDPIHASGACYCGECKYRNTDDCATRYETSCGAFYKLENDKDFCSYGERKRREKGETDMDKGIEINIPLDSYPIEVQIDVLEDLLAMLMTARDVLTEMEKR